MVLEIEWPLVLAAKYLLEEDKGVGNFLPQAEILRGFKTHGFSPK